MAITVGSILHGAYGDYYEQMVALRLYKQEHPDHRLILFFATESRRKELRVFDVSFADEVHPALAIPTVPVDSFLQFQVLDRELQTDVLDKLPAGIRAMIDPSIVNKPWTWVRRAWRVDPGICNIGLSSTGQEILPQCMVDNGVGADFYRDRITVGFLWRYRSTTGFISNAGQPAEDQVRASKSALLQYFIDEFGASVLVAGMNLKVDDTNRERTDCKFSDHTLAVSGDCKYLKGLNWGLGSRDPQALHAVFRNGFGVFRGVVAEEKGEEYHIGRSSSPVSGQIGLQPDAIFLGSTSGELGILLVQVPHPRGGFEIHPEADRHPNRVTRSSERRNVAILWDPAGFPTDRYRQLILSNLVLEDN